jgi:hypothetical protein
MSEDQESGRDAAESMGAVGGGQFVTQGETHTWRVVGAPRAASIHVTSGSARLSWSGGSRGVSAPATSESITTSKFQVTPTSPGGCGYEVISRFHFFRG